MTDRPSRAFPVFLGLSFQADRSGAWATLILFTLRPLAAVMYALGLAAMLAAVLDRSLATAILAACVACVMLVVQVASSKVSLSISARMVDRTGRLVDRDLQEMLHGTRTLGHFHDPALLDKLEVIRTERPRLTEGADVTGLILGTLLRLGLTVVVAAIATPWLLLVPVAAAVSYACTMRAEHARHAARTAAAEAARLRGEFFAIGTDPAHRDELLLSDGLAFTLAQHEAWGAEADRARARGMWIGFLWAVGGVAVTTAAFGVGVYSLTVSLLTGSTPVATGLAALLLLSNVTVLMSALIRYFSALSDSLRTTRLLLEARETLDDRGMSRAAEPGAPAASGIELCGVSFRYPAADGLALDAIDLVLRPGKVYALVGANGSGKTTLVHVLAGLLRPTAGSIAVGGVVADPDPGERTSIVSQGFARFEFRLEDSIRLGAESASASDIARVLADSGLREDLERNRLTIQSPLGRSFPDGTELSGGQWQRVAICRGLLPTDPTLLTLDEPTSAIDPLAEDRLLSNFAAWSREVAKGNDGIAVIVTHRMSLVKEVDEVILMDRGRVVAVAPHEDLLEHREYQLLYDAQQRAYAKNPDSRAERNADN